VALTVANPGFSHLRGFNYQPSYGSTGYELWRRFDAEVIDRELARGRKFFPAMNAVRFWLSWDAFVREPKIFTSNFETALSICDRHDLPMMPVLFNRWHDAHLDYGGIYLEHFYLESSHLWREGMYDAYLEEIVGAHAGDERIFSWDLCNEPFLYHKGRCELPSHPELRNMEAAWLRDLYTKCKGLGARAPITVGTHPGTDLALVDGCSDFLSVHPYWDELFKYAGGVTFEQLLDSWVDFANRVNKPLVATETCWGSQDDAHRVSIIRYTLGELRKRNISFLVYLLHHSLIADAHRIEFGPLGRPGNLSFIEANGSLRPGHEVWNDFV